MEHFMVTFYIKMHYQIHNDISKYIAINYNIDNFNTARICLYFPEQVIKIRKLL